MNDVTKGSQSGEPLGRYRVLVVDDDPTHLEYIRTILAAAGIQVSVCSSPQAALREAAAREPFHVVCADYQMPGMDGLELLGKIQGMIQDVSSVLITAVSNQIEPERKKDSGVICVILKPFESAVLVNLVTRLARLTELQRRARRITFTPRASNRTTPSVA